MDIRITNSDSKTLNIKIKNIVHRMRQGSTLVEMLMTVLLLSIILVGATTGVSTAVKVYRKTVLKTEALVLLSTLSTEINAEFKDAVPDKMSGEILDSQGYFWSGIRGYKIKIRNNSPEIDSATRIVIELPASAGGTPVVMELLSDSFYGDTLKAKMSYTSMPSSGTNGGWEYTLTIYTDNIPELAAQRFYVNTLNYIENTTP